MNRREFVTAAVAALIVAPFVELTGATTPLTSPADAAAAVISGKSIQATVLGYPIQFAVKTARGLVGPVEVDEKLGMSLDKKTASTVGWTGVVNGKTYGHWVALEDDAMEKPEVLADVIDLLAQQAEMILSSVGDRKSHMDRVTAHIKRMDAGEITQDELRAAVRAEPSDPEHVYAIAG